ncbi:hypothetical protein BH23CHL4_BH23CHL4_09720 [soil metagenome]
MIVDSHSHIFPHLAGKSGFPTEADHRKLFQLTIATHSEPVHRLRDHAEAPEAIQGLLDRDLQSLDDLRDDTNFRISGFGRFEWDWNGETYYRSFMPPCLQDMTTPAGYILQEMARAGIDMAILQNAGIYGRLNEEFALAMRDYPDKLIGLADVWPAETDTVAESERLTHAICNLGLKGIYFTNSELVIEGHKHRFDDPIYDGYWETVRSLGIPVFWAILGVPMPNERTYLEEVDRLDRWCQRFPDIPSLLTHGFAPDLLGGDMPDPVARLLTRESMMIELLYPIHWGRLHTYPYPELRPVIQKLIDRTGPDRLTWGSDMPNVLRNCTYKQSLDYLFPCLEGLVNAVETDAILGGNVLRLVGYSGERND